MSTSKKGESKEKAKSNRPKKYKSHIRDKDGLTPLQKKFCHEYLVDFHCTNAAIRAGCKPGGASQTANKFMESKPVQAYLQRHGRGLMKKIDVQTEDLLRELSIIGFSDIRNYFDEKMNAIPLHELDRKITSAIESVKVRHSTFRTGRTTEERITTEFKLHSKLDAIEKLGRYLGMFEKDNKQKQPINAIQINRSIITSIHSTGQEAMQDDSTATDPNTDA
ncbi:MAG: terminase small subunit [Bacteroidetes bacterium]|nr:MAG: terminase small subunit [Bacteroidota bacterium]REK06407.1 MAG: terminase small subunit [Bacteroidota bacterium]REK33173.1 MAG: terminase small subunit [Bacteroidota bacterium]REK47009.1 MAG: terminase small subunit [Bacteroidota bacterium]